jgi:hypothetical protein
MRLNLLIVFIILFTSASAICNESKKINEVPECFKNYIDTMECKSTFMDIYNETGKPLYISKKEALEDIKMIRYLFDNAYSGKTYWKKKGVSFKNMYNSLENYANKNQKVSVLKLLLIIKENLKIIKDGHLTISGINDIRFYSHKNAYFADIVIEKKDDKYIVVRTKNKNVKTGMQFIDDKEKLFLTLSANKKKEYLLGILSYEYTPKMKVKFDKGEFDITLHNCKLTNSKSFSDSIFAVKTVDDIDVLKVNSFSNRFMISYWNM